MPDFVMPEHFRVNTRGGDLDIPAGAIVHTREDNEYLGYTYTVVEEVTAVPTPEQPAEEVPVAQTDVSTPEQPAEV